MQFPRIEGTKKVYRGKRSVQFHHTFPNQIRLKHFSGSDHKYFPKLRLHENVHPIPYSSIWQTILADHSYCSSVLDVTEPLKAAYDSVAATTPVLVDKYPVAVANTSIDVKDHSYCASSRGSAVHSRVIYDSFSTVHAPAESEINKQNKAEATPPTTILESLLRSDVAPEWKLNQKPRKMYESAKQQQQASLFKHSMSSNDPVLAIDLPLSTGNTMENTQAISVDSFDKICRICFSQKELKPFFLLEFEGILLQQIYTKLTSLVADKDDKLPGHICVDCIKTIINLFEFIHKCEKSYALLKEVVYKSINLLEESNNTGETLQEDDLNKFNIPNNFIADNNNESSSWIVPTNEDNKDIVVEFPDLVLNTNYSSLQNDSNSPEVDFIKEEIEEELPFACTPCRGAFSSAFELQVHVLGSKQCRLKMYQCRFCKAGFSSFHKLKMHMRVHATKYKCGVCRQYYRHLDALKRHQKVHKKRTQPKIIVQQIRQQHSCSVCNEDFTSFNDVKQHFMESHRGVDWATLGMVYYPGQNHTEGKDNDIKTYLCTVCGKLLKNFQDYHTHMKSHTEPSQKVVCRVCKKEFGSKADLTIHMNLHSRIKRHLCSICGRTFAQQQNLFIHVRNHVDLKPFCCHICNKKFYRSVNLKQHLDVCTKIKSLLSEQDPPFSCKKCAAAFDAVAELQTHILENRKCRPKLYHCSLCKTKCSSSGRLQVHMRVHSKVKPYQCDICGVKFRYRGNISRHKKNHEKKIQQKLLREKIAGQSESLHLCKMCNAAFTSSDDLKQHMESHVCEKCGKSYTTPTSLQKHKYDCPANRRKGNLKQWLCSQCPRKFRFQSRLYLHEQDHAESKRTDVTTNLCTVCGKLFRNRSAFWTHMRSHTEPPKKVVCKVCNKEFANTASIYLHMKIHAGIRRHVCSICGKAFMQKPHLFTHYKVHADLKPFSCHICDKKFREKGNLTQHIRFCSGVTPFHCSVCDKGLTSSTSLKKHMETHLKLK